MKIYLTESFQTQIIKGTIDIEPSNYPELEGKTRDEILDYLNRNSQDMYLTVEDEEMDWSIYDVLSEQETVREKETNYETHIHIEE
jgi:hypothetical protein